MRCEICGDGEGAEGFPDWLCWDSRALPEEVHDWVRRLKINPNDQAGRYLGSIGSPPAAIALREYLTIDDPMILALIVNSLGWSGNASDGPALISLIDHSDKRVRRSAAESLAELEITSAVEPLAARLARLDDDEQLERGWLLECLAWLRDPGILLDLREIVQTGGLCAQVGHNWAAFSLARVGDASDRASMAQMAIAHLESSAADGFIEPYAVRAKEWWAYEQAVGAVAPEELAATRAGLSDSARRALSTSPHSASTPEPSESETAEFSRPRRSIASFVDSPLPNRTPPQAKFFGQPDWLERPAWPIGGDGVPLLFYGQIPLGENHTAYLFTGGPEEWQILGPGSALVIQPGGTCHLPTVELAVGPQCYDWIRDGERFRRRSRREPHPERFIVWADGADPEEFATDFTFLQSHWNKVGGTPVWLQPEETPGPEWKFAFQFEASFADNDRADGAVFYGLVSDFGEGALCWQCR